MGWPRSRRLIYPGKLIDAGRQLYLLLGMSAKIVRHNIWAALLHKLHIYMPATCTALYFK